MYKSRGKSMLNLLKQSQNQLYRIVINLLFMLEMNTITDTKVNIEMKYSMQLNMFIGNRTK